MIVRISVAGSFSTEWVWGDGVAPFPRVTSVRGEMTQLISRVPHCSVAALLPCQSLSPFRSPNVEWVRWVFSRCDPHRVAGMGPR